jgi:uncharacterized membrane protein YoaK (UPF0700 family)
VDALGFLALSGYFVSFMSGNSTRLGVGLVIGWHAWLPAAFLIAAFVIGVMCGTAVARISRDQRGAAVLSLVTLLLLTAAITQQFDMVLVSTGLMAAAMGAENSVFERDGEVSVGVTYMTGTLVKLGQHLVASLCGEAGFAWLSYFVLWAGLIAGAAIGAASYGALMLSALWPAVAAATVMALIAWRWRIV